MISLKKNIQFFKKFHFVVSNEKRFCLYKTQVVTQQRNTNSTTMDNIDNFDSLIEPFVWCDHEKSYSVILNIGSYGVEIFQSREDEGFEGGGYDWQSLAHVFLEERMNELINVIKFDSESSMFCCYSDNKEALRKFILKFKQATEDIPLCIDLLSRAELD